MKRWVKKELKKDPIRSALAAAVLFARKNRNTVIAAAAFLILAGIFGLMMLRSRAAEGREAARSYARVQSEFSRFNYEESAAGAAEIISRYPRGGINDHALYLKGLSYHKLGELPQAREALEKAADRYGKSRIISEIMLALGEVSEETGDLESALTYYGRVSERHYLKPAALLGEARVYELKGEGTRAVDLYRRISARHPNTYWAEFASMRLEALGASPGATEQGGITPG